MMGGEPTTFLSGLPVSRLGHSRAAHIYGQEECAHGQGTPAQFGFLPNQWMIWTNLATSC